MRRDGEHPQSPSIENPSLLITIKILDLILYKINFSVSKDTIRSLTVF